MSKKNSAAKLNVAEMNCRLGYLALYAHPMFAPLCWQSDLVRHDRNLCPPDGWAVVTDRGQIHVHPTRRAEKDEWVYVLAHCLLHLGFGHFQPHDDMAAWNTACDMFVTKFLHDLKFGTPPPLDYQPELFGQTEDRLYRQLCERGIPENARDYGIGGAHAYDMIADPVRPTAKDMASRLTGWSDAFGRGLSAAVTSAVNVVGGAQESLQAYESKRTLAQAARSWFISSYPLLGALATAFKIIEDAALCTRLNISVAAVDAEAREIYVNPNALLTDGEARFVLAHELLHVGLSHHTRAQGRDPFLWNVACDYVINDWLVEMHVGDLPRFGGMHDPTMRGESAETVYDRIVTDLRYHRKSITLRGVGVGDMIVDRIPDWWRIGDGLSLDEFYRRCLAQGLLWSQSDGRGLFPAGLVAEIEALSQPPIPWDVALAKWFDSYFAPLEKMRTYARPSRRQASTPDIPRPRWIPQPIAEDGRTFGVVLDTSGSMDRTLLAKALGAIASYSITHDVAAVRVVFCDAAAYDQGYMPPEVIAQRVAVRGGGGTVLQPAIDLLERAEDFPKDGPLLIITDGQCDRVRIWRDHAFLMPQGKSLPFAPKGEVFRIE